MHIVGFQMRCHRVSETLACYIKVSRRLLYCTSEPALLRVPEGSQKLGLLLKVSRRHVARQSSHISDTLVFFKCLSAMCTRWFPKSTDQQVSYEF